MWVRLESETYPPVTRCLWWAVRLPRAAPTALTATALRQSVSRAPTRVAPWQMQSFACSEWCQGRALVFAPASQALAPASPDRERPVRCLAVEEAARRDPASRVAASQRRSVSSHIVCRASPELRPRPFRSVSGRDRPQTGLRLKEQPGASPEAPEMAKT